MTDRNAAAMATGKSVKQELAKDDDGKTVNRDKSSNTAAPGNHKTPTKKRRKVNHGTSYKKGPLLACTGTSCAVAHCAHGCIGVGVGSKSRDRGFIIVAGTKES